MGLNKLMDWKDVIEFFASGKWWPTIMGALIAGILVLALLDFLFSQAWWFGVLIGISLAVIDLVCGARFGYSLLEGIAGFIDNILPEQNTP